MKSENKEFTVSTLAERVSNPVRVQTVADVFKQHIANLEDEKRAGYAASVKQVYNSLLKFNKHLDIYFSEIDISWLKRYEVWLRKQGTAENTIGVRFRTLRMVFNLAIELEAVKAEYYPFKKYKVSKLHQTTAKRAITKKEVMSIINYPKEGKDFYTVLAVNMFAFSYFMGGINFVDMSYLTTDNLKGNRLIYVRRKTGKLINLPIQKEAMYSFGDYNSNSFLFPVFSSYHKTEQQKQNRLHKVITKVNRALKTIGKELNIPVKLTTYVARHSYATVLKRAGVSTSLICESLGHSSEKVTQIYLDSFGSNQIDEAMRNLL